MYATITAVTAVEIDSYRNLVPMSMLKETKELGEERWKNRTTHGLGSRPDTVQRAFDVQPETLCDDQDPIPA